MEGSNPLYEEIPNPVGNEQKKPQINEEKGKINHKQKAIPKKKKVSKQNSNINIAEVDGPKISEDDLEHPAPLLSDYSVEEEKEEIKEDFYRNKLKEKEKMIKNNDNISHISSNIPQKQIKINNKNHNKMRVLNNGIELISNKNENNKDDYLQISIKIKDKDIDEGESKLKKIIIKGNNSIKKINQKNNINKTQNQGKIPIKNNQKHLNKIPQIKKLKTKISSHKIIKKSMNLNPSSYMLENRDTKELIHPNKKVMKIKSNNNLTNKNSFSNTLENEYLQNNQKRIEDINPYFIQKEAQAFQNNNYYYNYQIKKKIIPNKLAKKSQSYSNISLNNICSNNSQINYNHNIVSKERGQMVSAENNIKEEKLNNLKSPIKIPHHSNNDVSKKMAKKISIPLDFAKYQNISNTYRKESNTHYYYNNQNINNTVKVNSIFNSYNYLNQISEQKENVQNNSQYKKHTFQNGGKFNNIQTTYVVISKNSNSNGKLIQKNINTIEYENNRYLNTVQFDFLLKKSRFFSPQKNNPILNTEKKACQNPNCYKYYSPFNNFSKTQSKNLIKMHKSYNNVKSNYNNYYYQKTVNNNYRANYMNNLDNTIKPSKSNTVANQNRNNNYLIDQSGGNRGRRIEKFENYYDYCGEGHISKESYFSSSTTNKYASYFNKILNL